MVTTTAKYIRFIEQPNLGNKTKLWIIMSKADGYNIGKVKWYSPWRKYCFFPAAETIFEEQCLRDVALFCETETKNHRENNH